MFGNIEMYYIQRYVMNQDNNELNNVLPKGKFNSFILPVLMLFLYSFTYSMVFSFYNEHSLILLSEDTSFFHYRLIQLSFTAGLIIYGLFLSIKKLNVILLSRISATITLLTAPLILLVYYADIPILFLASIYVLTFLIGMECVYLNYMIVSEYRTLKRIGIINGISLSLSITLQFLIQMIGDNLILYFLLISCFALAILIFTRIIIVDEKKTSLPTFYQFDFQKLLIISFIIIFLLEVLGNFLTYSLILGLSRGNNIVFASPRLFMILSYLIMGFAADIKDMKYIPVITFTGILIGILNPILFRDENYLYFNTCIFYIIAGIINSFLVLNMWKLANGRKFAPLIAVSGRIIDSLFTLIFVSPIISGLPLPASIGIELTIIIIVLLLYVFTGQFSFVPQTHIVVDNISPELFAKQYGFTKKETDVFIATLNHNGNASELADYLYISRSVLYKNFQRIQEKTGQDSYQGVKNLYYSTRIPNKFYVEDNVKVAEDNFEVEENLKTIITEKIVPDINLEKTISKESKSTSDILERNETGSKKPVNSSSEMVKKEALTTESEDDKDVYSSFAEKYSLSQNELSALQLFMENPGMTQKDMAVKQGVTLRTMQRYLANIKSKTGAASLSELSNMVQNK